MKNNMHSKPIKQAEIPQKKCQQLSKIKLKLQCRSKPHRKTSIHSWISPQNTKSDQISLETHCRSKTHQKHKRQSKTHRKTTHEHQKTTKSVQEKTRPSKTVPQNNQELTGEHQILQNSARKQPTENLPNTC